jgi:hypothetical protein
MKVLACFAIITTFAMNCEAQSVGNLADVTIIDRDSGVALFRERSPVVTDAPSIPVPAPAAAAAAPDARTAAPAAMAEIGPPPLAAPKLGTGHGEREYSYVSHTLFTRLQSHPNEVIRIRYDSLDNLLAMGIVKLPPSIPPTLNPFPGSQQPHYVPDPPG